MRSPRWQKLWRDVATERGRIAMMVAAIAVSLLAVGTVLGGYAILSREMTVNYLGTSPASATLEIEGGVDDALVAAVRQHPAIAEAEARDVVLARMQVGDDWRPLLLFVVRNFDDLRLNTFTREAGEWPPPTGTVLLERTAVRMVEATTGGTFVVKTPAGHAQTVRITGLVHDPGLAPAWQEREGYAYTTVATLAQLGEPAVLHELRITVRAGADDTAAIEATAAELSRWLAERGHVVTEIRVPPPLKHPHQRQMTAILGLLFSFCTLALVLSAVLVATSLAAMLARQVREIGVMKTVGARAGQIAAMYAVLVAGVSTASLAVAVPLAIVGARAMAATIGGMLNLTITDTSLPAWVFGVEIVAGAGVPLLLAAVPIRRASRVTVRETLDQHGGSGEIVRGWFTRFPAPVRNALRRPARLALTLTLLAAGGALFMTAINVSAAWEANLARIPMARHYDVEVRLQRPESTAIAERLRAIPGVRTVEAWGYSPAALARPGEVDIVRTWPDRGHGSLAVLAPPPETPLVTFPVLAGRWLRPDDTDAVVLNHAVLAQAPTVAVGDTILLSTRGAPRPWKVVGIVEEIGSSGVAYVTDRAFAAATGTEDQARMLRIATESHGPAARAEAIRAVEHALADVGVEAVIPLAELQTAVGDHVVILINMLVAMAGVLATVGTLGLATTMGTSVIERTREIGVMKAIGATPRRIIWLILAEALAIAAGSWGLALLLSLPLTYALDQLLGSLGFLAALPFVIAPAPPFEWLALLLGVSALATVVPARRAAATTVREALG